MRPETISAMCHDLRSPLTAIAGAFSVLDATIADDGSPAQRRVLQVGMRAADRLADLIDDVHLLTRLEAGLGLAPPARVPMGPLLARAAAALAEEAAHRGQAIATATPQASSPVDAHADAHAAARALHVMLVRAIAVSPAGATIVAEAREEGAAIHVEVHDAAGAEPARDLADAFTAFQGGPGAGAGVGLALVRAVARAHGEDAWVEPLPAGGLLVRLALPAARAHDGGGA